MKNIKQFLIFLLNEKGDFKESLIKEISKHEKITRKLKKTG